MASPHDLDKLTPWHVSFKLPWSRKNKLSGDDLEYMQDVRAALMAQATPASSAILYTFAVLTTAAIIWASISSVDEVTQADARVIPSNREQVINNLEGGVLAEIRVSEGEAVTKGQPLALLNPTRFESQYQEGMLRQRALNAARARLKAEAYSQPLNFPSDVRLDKTLVDTETKNYQARKKVLDESIAAIQKSQQLLKTEIDIAKKLSEQGLFSLVELSRLQRQDNELSQQIMERQNRYRAEANVDLARIESELAQLAPNLTARLDTFQRTTIIAPINGIVKNIRVTTMGAAIPPSAPILDIVPADDKLLFEARLDPKEVSHVHPGLPVSIKLAAYDSTIFGEINGEVQMISPDTFREENKPAESAQGGYYRVMIQGAADPNNPKQKSMQIIPGMTAVAQIKTGEKTIMHYLLKPLTKAKEAFRER